MSREKRIGFLAAADLWENDDKNVDNVENVDNSDGATAGQVRKRAKKGGSGEIGTKIGEKIMSTDNPQKNPHAFSHIVLISMWIMWITISQRGFRRYLRRLRHP